VNALGAALPDERLLLEGALAARAQLREGDALGGAADDADRAPAVLGERLAGLEPERRADQRVVADLGVGVERQV
jgi:hypothetical protein